MERDDNQRRPDGIAPVPAVPGAGTRLLQPWRRITGQLAGLIGESGVCALFGRTVRMLAPRHGWLSVGGERSSIEALLATLERDLAGVNAEQAAAANAELLATFTRLLAALIGEGLTARLLADAGKEPDGRDGPQEAQEQK